ncbi:MAG: endonuclease/exonuclease/phosphatase family protein [Gemmatimonadales bacterium]
MKASGMRRTALLLALVVLAGCRTGRNYATPDGPRFAGGPAEGSPGGAADTSRVRVVSFNVEFSQHVDSAIAVLTSDPALRGADVLLLQEMNEDATRRIAEALGLWYVYYPAIFHFRTNQLFGNAVLSRWPIVEDRKIVLPHLSRFVRTQRTATAATIRVGRALVRVYSTHLGTMGDLAPAAHRDQLRAILADAEHYPRVVIGGDMNDASVGQVARARGYAWPTEHGPATTWLGRLDHIFLKGLSAPDSPAPGTVLNVGGASDHLAVWAVGILR